MNRTTLRSTLRALPAALLFLAAVAARGQVSGTLSDRGYERMRQLARELDSQARHANDDAARRDSRVYRQDKELLRDVSSFARRTAQLRTRMDRYPTAPWKVDDELRSLLAAAQSVESRLERSRYADQRVAADWNQVERLLDEMVRLYQADARAERGPGRRGEQRPARVSEAGPARPAGAYDYGRADIPSLAHELAQRAARVAGATRLPANPSPFDSTRRPTGSAVRRFAEQAGALDDRLEAGLFPDSAREEIARLSEAARSADLELRGGNLAAETRADWDAAKQILDRLRSVAGL